MTAAQLEAIVGKVKIGCGLAGVGGTSATNGENHVGGLHVRIGAKGVGSFVGDIVAVLEEAGDFNVAVCHAGQKIVFGSSHGFFATDDDGLGAVSAANVRHAFVHVFAANTIRWKEYGLCFHENNSFD